MNADADAGGRVSDDPTALRDLAIELARGAGQIALEGRKSVTDADTIAGATKSSSTDVVTEFDRAAERHIVEVLRRLRPDDAIVGEEGTNDSGTSGFSWLIDPIDGTTNFVFDQPAWSCSVAVADDERTVAGAVAVPPLGELFAAAVGCGATLNDRPIHVSSATDLSLALVGTGFGFQPETRREQALVVVELITQVRDIRRLGSAAVDLCMVACGRLDAYYELHLNAWDAAAGELIAREAGAITSDFEGRRARPEQMLVAAPGVHAAMIEALRGISPAH